MNSYKFETFKENEHRMIVYDNAGNIIDIAEQHNPNSGDLPKLTLFGYWCYSAKISFDDFNIDKFLFGFK